MLVRFDLIARALPFRPPFPIEIGRIFQSRLHTRAGRSPNWIKVTNRSFILIFSARAFLV
jgi:hypothetical protein